ncbi:hypothetical protein Mal15_38390 [Stieleria maiorica]|uniref:Uncharacterized protein n=1 Tax=Stieleria maiorica TaxID=2795974 RepID=A0A5B9MET0_9BACT|nr:hypothetical protein [Stieleria maiorica]QEF99772.1 hypothetical protein Mal15_38390 [Stieleria maiorica]
MLHLRLRFPLGIVLSLVTILGCGSGSGSARPVADLDELSQFLDENPELNVDGLEEMDEELDLAE